MKSVQAAVRLAERCDERAQLGSSGVFLVIHNRGSPWGMGWLFGALWLGYFRCTRKTTSNGSICPQSVFKLTAVSQLFGKHSGGSEPATMTDSPPQLAEFGAAQARLHSSTLNSIPA